MSAPFLWTGRTIDVHDARWFLLEEDQRQVMRDWFTAQGVPVNQTFVVEYDLIDGPLLRYAVYLADNDGHRYYDADSRDAAMETRLTALRNPLPDWWRPDTPTGETHDRTWPTRGRGPAHRLSARAARPAARTARPGMDG